jgi:hypothetical protein
VVDDVAWGALTLSLTVLGALYTVHAYRRRGLVPAMRGAGLTLLPLAALLTGTLRMFTRMADAVADWATSLVFSPAVWLGVVVAGVAVVLLGAAKVADARGLGARPGQGVPQEQAGQAEPRHGRGRDLPPSEPVDDDLAEIEAILRKRGIS